MIRIVEAHRRTLRIIGSLSAVGILLGTAFVTGAYAGHVTRATAASPTYGGSYAERLTNPPDCLDPQKTGSASSNMIDSYVLDPLLDIDAKGHYVGDLATHYKVASGGTRITFTLRKNVTFSNGDPFTASAVKFTFDRALNPATKSPVTASDLDALQSVKVINKYTVELILKTPSRPLLTNLASAYTGILDPKSINAQGANTCNAPVGTGSYKIQSTGTAFSDVVVVANKRHNFGTAWVHNKGVPWVSRVEFPVVTSDSTAVSELLSSGIDIMAVPGTQLTRVQGNSSLPLHTVKPTNLSFLEFNTAAPPFNDIQVRKAFAEIVNRANIISAALSGQGKAVYDPLPPAVPFFDKAAAKYMPKYNLSDATKIIAAKHATGPYTLLIVPLPTYSTMAEILQQAAGQAGMQLTIQPEGSLGAFIGAASKGNFNVLALGYGANDPDILYNLLDTTQGNGAGLNWTGDTTNTKLDNLLVKGRTTLQSKKAAAIYDQAQVLINKQLEFLGVLSATGFLAVRSNIKGYHINATGGAAIQDYYIKTK